MEEEFRKRLKIIEKKYNWFKLKGVYVRIVSTHNTFALNWTGEGINLPKDFQDEVAKMLDSLI